MAEFESASRAEKSSKMAVTQFGFAGSLGSLPWLGPLLVCHAARPARFFPFLSIAKDTEDICASRRIRRR